MLQACNKACEKFGIVRRPKTRPHTPLQSHPSYCEGESLSVASQKVRHIHTMAKPKVSRTERSARERASVGASKTIHKERERDFEDVRRGAAIAIVGTKITTMGVHG